MMHNATKLRKLILENPDLPLLIFVGEETNTGEYDYELAEVSSVSIQELILYGEYWIDKDEYYDQLDADLTDLEEYRYLTGEEYKKMIAEKVRETEFVKAIVVYVG